MWSSVNWTMENILIRKFQRVQRRTKRVWVRWNKIQHFYWDAVCCSQTNHFSERVCCHNDQNDEINCHSKQWKNVEQHVVALLKHFAKKKIEHAYTRTYTKNSTQSRRNSHSGSKLFVHTFCTKMLLKSHSLLQKWHENKI